MLVAGEEEELPLHRDFFFGFCLRRVLGNGVGLMALAVILKGAEEAEWLFGGTDFLSQFHEGFVQMPGVVLALLVEGGEDLAGRFFQLIWGKVETQKAAEDAFEVAIDGGKGLSKAYGRYGGGGVGADGGNFSQFFVGGGKLALEVFHEVVGAFF